MMWILLILVVSLFVLASSIALKRSSTRFFSLQQATHLASHPLELLKLFHEAGGGLPSWLTQPNSDFTGSTTAWLNTTTLALWPRVQRAAVPFQPKIEHLLNSSTFWKPTWLQGTEVNIQQFVLGQTPPSITALKVYPPPSTSLTTELHMDVDFEWSSSLQVKLSIKPSSTRDLSFVDWTLSIVYKTVSIRVFVRDLVARGRVRITLTPLLDCFPIVGAVKLSFLEPPSFSYQVNSMGINPLMVPGLDAWLESFITTQVLQPFTFPQALTLPIAHLFGIELGKIPMSRPEGVIIITIKKATNVPRTDFFGLSDPYVKAYLAAGSMLRTSVKANTLKPVWNEDLTFLVHSVAHQRLVLELWDSDTLRPDDKIAHADIPLTSILHHHSDTNRRPGDEDIILGMKRVARKSYHVESSSSTNSNALLEGLDSSSSSIPGTNTSSTSNNNSSIEVGEAYNKGGMLYIHFTQAHALEGSKSSFAKAYKIKVKIGRGIDCSNNNSNGGILMKSSNGHPNRSSRVSVGNVTSGNPTTSRTQQQQEQEPKWRYKKTTERSGFMQRMNKSPVLDIDVDFFLDGHTVLAPHTVVQVELWVVRQFRRPAFRGMTRIPLNRVIKSGTLRDRWTLEGVESGSLDMELEFAGLMSS